MLFRLSGGEGAYSGAPAPAAVDGRRARRPPDPAAMPRFAGGRVIAERRFDRGEPAPTTPG